MRESYYSLRTGINLNIKKFDLSMLLRLLKNTSDKFESKGYYQEYFGFFCRDTGYNFGKIGSDIEAVIYLKTRKERLWPISKLFVDEPFGNTEDDIFDMIEFIYDHISKPIEGFFHSFYNCGMHYNTFDRKSGQEEFKIEINRILKNYKDGFEISNDGEIVHCIDNGFEDLRKNILFSDKTIEEKIDHAIRKFRLYKSSEEDRHDAVRVLADILESLRPKAQQLSRKRMTKIYLI